MSLKVGLAGIGFMGWIHWLAYQRVASVDVVAISSRDEKKRQGDWTSIKGNFGPEGEQVDLSGVEAHQTLSELLQSDVDLVDLCSPPHLHVEQCLQVIEAGKHVFCEKPLALNASDCSKLVDAASQNGVKLFVGHVLPFFPEYTEARKLIDSGEYGKPIGGCFKRIISDPTWIPDFFDPEKVGGPLIDLHVHDSHLIRLLFGMPDSVSSTGRMRDDVPEFVHSVFDFRDREFAVAATCGVINQQGRPFTHGFEIYLEKATLNFELGAYADEVEIMPLKVLDSTGQVIRPELSPGDDIAGFEAEIQEVVDCLTANRDSTLLGGDLARDAIVLAEAQCKAVRERQTVSISN